MDRETLAHLLTLEIAITLLLQVVGQQEPQKTQITRQLRLLIAHPPQAIIKANMGREFTQIMENFLAQLVD